MVSARALYTLVLLLKGCCAKWHLPINEPSFVANPRCVEPPAPNALYLTMSLSDAVNFATDPATGFVTFISGNRAMNLLAKNFAASVYCLARPFPFVMAPLDKAGREDLLRAPYMTIYQDAVAEGLFSETESVFGEARYHSMARYKWNLAQQLLQVSGKPVAWFDPDIVVLRNPLHYMATLPICDFVMQTEVGALEFFDTMDDPQEGYTSQQPLSRATRKLVGQVATLARVSHTRELIFNTGVVLIQPTSNASALIRRVLSTFQNDADSGWSFDDQSRFTRLMDEEYWIEGTGSDRPDYRARNRVIRTNMMHGACSRFVHRSTGESFSVWLLNPVMFPLRPTVELSSLYSVYLEPPYLKHYNWVVGTGAKARRLHRAGEWRLRDAPPPAREGDNDRTLELLSGTAAAGCSKPK